MLTIQVRHAPQTMVDIFKSVAPMPSIGNVALDDT